MPHQSESHVSFQKLLLQLQETHQRELRLASKSSRCPCDDGTETVPDRDVLSLLPVASAGGSADSQSMPDVARSGATSSCLPVVLEEQERPARGALQQAGSSGLGWMPEYVPRSEGSKGRADADGSGDDEPGRDTQNTIHHEIFSEKNQKDMTEKTPFLVAIIVLVILNSAMIGVQLEMQMQCERERFLDQQAQTCEQPLIFTIMNYLFNTVFTLELLLRLWFSRRQFFCGSMRGWNLFDAVLVGLGIVEMVSGSVMSTLKVLRIAKTARIWRIARLFPSFRKMVNALLMCVSSLSTLLVLLLLTLYVFGLTFMQIGIGNLDIAQDRSDFEDLEATYGSLGRSMLSLFQSISGGRDWDDVLQPVQMTNDGGFMSYFPTLLFLVYIFMVLFGMLNVVTGVFVENAIDIANGEMLTKAEQQKDQEDQYFREVEKLFNKLGQEDEHGTISRQQVEEALTRSEVKLYMKTLDIDVDNQQQKETLFGVLDNIDQDGQIDKREFLLACNRIRGFARSIDLAMLMLRNDRMQNILFRKLTNLEQALGNQVVTLEGSSAIGQMSSLIDVRSLPLDGFHKQSLREKRR